MKSIKKIFREGYIIFLIIIVTISSYVYMRVPKTYKKNFEGVLYRLGKENKDYCEKINITFDGRMTRDKWLKYKRYDGKVEFSDYEKIINNKKNIEHIKKYPGLSFIFDEYNNDFLHYYIIHKHGEETFDSEFETVGLIYFDEDFNRLSIEVDENNSWSSEDGLVISAPAKDREEALQISKDVLLDLFNNRIDELE